MKKAILCIACVFALFAENLYSIDVTAFQQFLNANKSLTYPDFAKQYDMGNFMSAVPYSPLSSKYFDSADAKFTFNKDEKRLFNKNGFVVTERVSYGSMWDGFKDVYQRDLPVFISTDAILHALHRSYDNILVSIELNAIIPQMKLVVDSMYSYTPTLAGKYPSLDMKSALLAYDVYFTVAKDLIYYTPTLGFADYQPYYAENVGRVDSLIAFIKTEGAARCKVFSELEKDIDFSQFTLRGHYETQSDYHPEIAGYFKAMMWLGRVELYLIPNNFSTIGEFLQNCAKTETTTSLLILEASESLGTKSKLEAIDKLLEGLIGESDNVQLKHLREIMDDCAFTSASAITQNANAKIFGDTLASKACADQKILSQIMFESAFGESDSIKPPSSFLLLGQRFLIDSYVLGNVVYDKVQNPDRMLPKSLDALFALGNNSALPLLKSELTTYSYSRNLAGLRYLIDTYDSTFWNASFYNSWLNVIRQLNVENAATRATLPLFTQTAAWRQEKMNTQLASWAELRHDNILYGKQSYSGGNSCSNPEGYLEANPKFYKAISTLAKNAKTQICDRINAITGTSNTLGIDNYFNVLDSYASKMEIIAQKELSNISLSATEKDFLCSVFTREEDMCGSIVAYGWYPDIFYKSGSDFEIDATNYIVADVHTAPTDEFGNMTGWVKHIGTGQMNLAVVSAKNADGVYTTFCGPVMSFLECTTDNFKRLTDSQWDNMIYTNDASILRPEFVDLYLVRKSGSAGDTNAVMLPVGVKDDATIQTSVSSQAFPNPFKDKLSIVFKINNFAKNISLKLFSANGKQIYSNNYSNVSSGSYGVQIDVNDLQIESLPDGVYIYTINADGAEFSGKAALKK